MFYDNKPLRYNQCIRKLVRPIPYSDWLIAVDYSPEIFELVDRYEEVLNYVEYLRENGKLVATEWLEELGVFQLVDCFIC